MKSKQTNETFRYPLAVRNADKYQGILKPIYINSQSYPDYSQTHLLLTDTVHSESVVYITSAKTTIACPFTSFMLSNRRKHCLRQRSVEWGGEGQRNQVDEVENSYNIYIRTLQQLLLRVIQRKINAHPVISLDSQLASYTCISQPHGVIHTRKGSIQTLAKHVHRITTLINTAAPSIQRDSVWQSTDVQDDTSKMSYTPATADHTTNHTGLPLSL